MNDAERILHCWQDKREWMARTHGEHSDEAIDTYMNGNGTCLLPAGHEGPHEWTPDDQIVVTFAPTTGTERTE
jgi:hypothetical protein